MIMEYTSKDLPIGITIWGNDFGEFVAIENGQVVQVTKYGHEHGVRCGKTVEEAVENYNKEAITK